MEEGLMWKNRKLSDCGSSLYRRLKTLQRTNCCDCRDYLPKKLNYPFKTFPRYWILNKVHPLSQQWSVSQLRRLHCHLLWDGRRQNGSLWWKHVGLLTCWPTESQSAFSCPRLVLSLLFRRFPDNDIVCVTGEATSRTHASVSSVENDRCQILWLHWPPRSALFGFTSSSWLMPSSTRIYRHRL